jgi:hypothetical protein
MIPGFIRISEFAKLADMALGSLYLYHAQKLYDFPSAELQIGMVKFWKRKTAVAWARKHKKRTRR